MADERTVSTTDVVSYLDNGDPDYIFEIVDKTARANITSINTTLGKKRSIFYCDYFKFNSADTTKTKQRYQFVGPYHKMTNGAKTFTAANLIAGDVCFSTEVRAYDGTTVIKRGLFALEYNYKSSSKYYSPAAYTYGEVDFDITDRLPQATSAANESVLAVNSSGDYYLDPDVIPILSQAVNDISDNTDAIDNLNSTVSDLSSSLSSMEGDITSLQDSVSELSGDIGGLQTDMGTAQGDINDLKDTTETLDSTVSEIEGLTDYMRNVGSSDYGKVLTWTNNAVWEAANVPKELPAVTSSDNGKVLKVASGAWTKAAETKELPSVTTSDNNKVLKVVSGAWAKAAAPTELPTVTSSDNGKVLGVANGAWAKTNIPTELPTVDDSDNQKILTVVSGDWIAAYPEPQLPTVSSADNGKVLGVSSGDWTTINMPTELPAVTSSDNGKVLKVASGAWTKAAETKELPAVTTSDNNKVLKVVSGAWAKAAETKELPTVTASDAGNVLTVNSSGKWAKAAPPTELPAVTSSDAYKVLAVNSSGAWAADDSYLQGMNSFNTRISALETKVPNVTASDNGVVLRVMNGVWSKSKPDFYQNINATTGEGSIDTGGRYYYDAQHIYPIKRGVRLYGGSGLGTIGPNNPLTVTNMPLVNGTNGCFLKCKLTFTKLNASYVQEGGFSANCDVKVEKPSTTPFYNTTWIITPYITYENVTLGSIYIFFEYIDYNNPVT
jgi:archaellum component FlaC